jgi:hypothetical protein
MSRRQLDACATGLEGDDAGGTDLKAPSEFRVPVPKAIVTRWGFEPVYGSKGAIGGGRRLLAALP